MKFLVILQLIDVVRNWGPALYPVDWMQAVSGMIFLTAATVFVVRSITKS